MKYITPAKALILALSMCFLAFSSLGIQGEVPTPSAFPGLPDFNISEKEMKSLYNYLESLDEKSLEELEQLTKKTLADMGIDYDTLQPLPSAGEKPTPSAVEEKKQEILPAKQEIEVPPMLLGRAKEVVKNLIDALEELRNKAATTLSYDSTLNRWLPDLNKISYYLRVINKEQHYKRLSDPKFESLFQSLDRLNKAIRIYSPMLSAPMIKPESYEDPYEILGIIPSATQEEIEKVYQELREFQDPQLIQERMAKAGRSQQEIDKAVQEASINFDFLTDAYQKLKDPATRKLLDQELQAYYVAQRATSRSLEHAREALAASIGDAVYKDQVLTKLEQFLKEYEPAELEERQKMEKAEAQRATESKEAASLKTYDTGKTQIVKTRQETRLPWEGLDFLNPTPSISKTPPPAKEITRTPEKSAPSEAKKGGGGGKPAKGKGKEKDKDEDEDKDKDKDKKEEEKEEKGDKDKGKDKKDEKKSKDKDKDKDKKKEELFDVLALQLLEFDEALSRFNQKFDRDFFLQAQIKQTPLDKLAPGLQAFSKATGLEEINTKLESLQKSLEKAEERKLKQYKTLWKEVEKNTKAFKANLTLADQAGRVYLMPEGRMPKSGPIKDAVAIIKLFGKVLENFTKVDKFISEGKAKKQDKQAKESKEKEKRTLLEQLRSAKL